MATKWSQSGGRQCWRRTLHNKAQWFRWSCCCSSDVSTTAVWPRQWHACDFALLRLSERVDFKLAVTAYKSLNARSPTHHNHNFLQPVSLLPGRRCLRSSSSNGLHVPDYRLSSIGLRSFPVAAAKTWNSLPDHVVSAPSLTVFRTRLKTYFVVSFLKFYCELLCSLFVVIASTVVF